MIVTLIVIALVFILIFFVVGYLTPRMPSIQKIVGLILAILYLIIALQKFGYILP